MAEGDRHPWEARSRRPVGWLRRRAERGASRTVVLVLVGALLTAVAAGALAAYRLDLGLLSRPSAPDPVHNPAAIPPPPALELPEPVSAPSVAAPRSPGALNPARVRRAVAALARDPRLGPRVGVAVAPLGGAVAYAAGPRVVVPASTMKLLTALAALDTLGPEHRFSTAVVRKGARLTLVGGGDPLLASRPDPSAGRPGEPETADLATLATRTAKALRALGRSRVRLSYDTSLFSGPAVDRWWEDDYVPDDVVSPVTALWVDEGRVAPGNGDRVDDPAATAATDFARLLAARGVRVVGRPAPALAPVRAERVAEVRGAQLVEVVQHVLEWSDNEGAEVLARHVALAEGLPGSFDGVARALPRVAARLGIDLRRAVVRDGSGLSRADRLPVRALLQVLGAAADPDRPALAGLIEGLPVAGFSGSLGYRFTARSDAGLGWVRAKTGTLTGVHGLAGVAVGADGALMAFVALVDRVPVQNTLFARDRLDQLASALAACRCSA